MVHFSIQYKNPEVHCLYLDTGWCTRKSTLIIFTNPDITSSDTVDSFYAYWNRVFLTCLTTTDVVLWCYFRSLQHFAISDGPEVETLLTSWSVKSMFIPEAHISCTVTMSPLSTASRNIWRVTKKAQECVWVIPVWLGVHTAQELCISRVAPNVTHRNVYIRKRVCACVWGKCTQILVALTAFPAKKETFLHLSPAGPSIDASLRGRLCASKHSTWWRRIDDRSRLECQKCKGNRKRNAEMFDAWPRPGSVRWTSNAPDWALTFVLAFAFDVLS